MAELEESGSQLGGERSGNGRHALRRADEPEDDGERTVRRFVERNYPGRAEFKHSIRSAPFDGTAYRRWDGRAASDRDWRGERTAKGKLAVKFATNGSGAARVETREPRRALAAATAQLRLVFSVARAARSRRHEGVMKTTCAHDERSESALGSKLRTTRRVVLQ
jgi:hypothetical protein